MTASKNVDVHYVSVPNVTGLRVHIEIRIISFEHIGSHFECMRIV